MKKETRRVIAIIATITVIKFVCSLAFLNDPALADVHRLDILPYGVLWQWTNPLYWTPGYPQLLVLYDLPATIINARFLSRRWFWAWTAMDFHWFQGFFANASVTWFSAYPVIGPIWTILQKLPIGYSWTFNDPHVNCALWCSGISGELAKGYIWRWGNIVTYSLIFVWAVVPTVVWIRNRHKPRAKESLPAS